MTRKSLRVYIGWDRREPEAYAVARYSLMRRASIPLEVRPIVLDEVKKAGLYWREHDPLSSTEFTYTRFLVPALANFEGQALFCDSDFLWLADVAELLAAAPADKAVCCVQHDYRPTETTKMDGAQQTTYPRKNWSSLMLFDCNHPAVRKLTPEIVNNSTPAYLHRFNWVQDNDIGALPLQWNWLEGWYKRPIDGYPKAVHFTRGGPWFPNWRDVEFADLWFAEAAHMKAAEAQG